jgi:hypothetical protein
VRFGHHPHAGDAGGLNIAAGKMKSIAKMSPANPCLENPTCFLKDTHVRPPDQCVFAIAA